MDPLKRKNYFDVDDQIYPKCTACVANAEWVDGYSFAKTWARPCKCSKFFRSEDSDWGGAGKSPPNGFVPVKAAICVACPVGCPSCSKDAINGTVTCNAPCADGYYFSADNLCYKIKNCKSYEY